MQERTMVSPPARPRPAVVRVARAKVLGASCEIMAAGSVPDGFPANAGDTLGICFKLGRGHGVWCEGRQLHYPDNAICVRTPGCYWACEPCRDGFVSLDIPAALLPAGLRADGMRFAAPEPVGILRAATLHRLADPRTPALAAESLLTALLLRLGQDGVLCAPDLHAEPHYRQVVRRARDFLLTHLPDSISLPRLARAAGTTRWGLIRAFARELTTTPHAYLVQLRLGRARALLRRGHPPAEAALLAGFADQAHLTRLMRRFSGEAPAAYQRRLWTGGPGTSVPASGTRRQFVTFVQAPPAASLVNCRPASEQGGRSSG